MNESQGRECKQQPIQRAGYSHHMVQSRCKNYLRTAIQYPKRSYSPTKENKQELFVPHAPHYELIFEKAHMKLDPLRDICP